MVTIVVAYCKHNRGIGANGQMPWHLPQELHHFRQITMGKVLIMGRTTYESLPLAYRPLPGRDTVVLTRSQSFRPQEARVEVARDFESALARARVWAGHREIIVAGGSEVYAQALPHTDQIVASEIWDHYDCDRFFPELDDREWQPSTSCHYPHGGFTIQRYQRISPPCSSIGSFWRDVRRP